MSRLSPVRRANLYRFQKLVQRNKLAFAAVSAVTVALVIGLSVSTWMFVRERKAHQQTMVAEQEQRSLREAAENPQAKETQMRQLAETREAAAGKTPTPLTWSRRTLRWRMGILGWLRTLLATAST